MTANQKFVQAQPFSLAGAGAVIGDTSITLKSFKQIDGVTNLLMTDFGTIGYGTLEPSNGTLEEAITFSGITQNANGTATLTGVKNNLFVSPYTQASGLAKTHAGSTPFVITNTAGFYNGLATLSDDETITGKWTFPGDNVNRPTLSSDNTSVTDTDLVTVGQLNRTAIAGAPDASDTVKGITKLSVAPVVPTDPIAVGDNDTRVPTQGENDALVGDNTDIAVGSGNTFVTQTGLIHNAEKYGADTSGSSTAYVVTLAPVVTSLTAGMVVYAKIVTANTTTTPTLNVNSLGAKTIVKGSNIALVVGDISANMLCTFMYDATNTVWVLQNPISVANHIYSNTGFKTGTITIQNSIQTETITHSLGIIPRLLFLQTHNVGTVGGGGNIVSNGNATITSAGTVTNQQHTYCGLNTTFLTGDSSTAIAFAGSNGSGVSATLKNVTSTTFDIEWAATAGVNGSPDYVWTVQA